MNKKNSRIFYGLLSFALLIIGISIYFLFRDLKNIVLFAWIPQPEFLKTVLVPLQPSVLADFLRYHLPDTLWFVSAIIFLRFIWLYKVRTQTIYIVCFYRIGIAFEASQLSEKVLGTFDWLDLFFMGIGAFIEGLLYKILIQRRFA